MLNSNGTNPPGLERSHTIEHCGAVSSNGITNDKAGMLHSIKTRQTRGQRNCGATYEQRERERKKKIFLELEMSGGIRKTGQARLLRRLQRAKEIKTMMTKRRVTRTNGHHHGVTSIEIPVHHDDDPKTCTEWKILTFHRK